MAVKVTINGFEYAGRLAFRQMFGVEGYDVIAINDLTDSKMLAHLLKYDTAQGGYAEVYDQGLYTIEAKEDSITVDGKKIITYKKPKVADLPWGETDVDIVLECTGFYCSENKTQTYIEAGARKVIIPALTGNNLPTIVYSVNENVLTTDDKITPVVSCTTNCLASMVKALNDYVPIQSGIMPTIRAYTGDQMILDGPHRESDLRRARTDAANVVPNSTSAAKAIGPIILELNGKLIGPAQHVLVPTGFTTILTAVIKRAGATKEDTNAVIKAAAYESFGYNKDAIVSFDMIDTKLGSLFDATQTMVTQIVGDLCGVQVASWCDSENSCASQMVRTIKYPVELG